MYYVHTYTLAPLLRNHLTGPHIIKRPPVVVNIHRLRVDQQGHLQRARIGDLPPSPLTAHVAGQAMRLRQRLNIGPGDVVLIDGNGGDSGLCVG